MRVRCLAIVLAAAFLAAGCAPHTRAVAEPAPPAPRVDDLDALIARGCYRCLEQAFEQAQGRGVRSRAFEAAALLTLRSKELGLPSEEWRDRAHTVVPDGEAYDLYLAAIDAVPPDRLSEARYTMFDRPVRNTRSMVPEWREALRDGPAPALFRAYLDVSLVCSFGRLSENAQSFTGTLDPVAESPLFQYGVGICDASHLARLTALRTDHADLVEADYAIGRYLIEDRSSGDPEEGLRRLKAAAEAFPRSAAIATWIGNVHRGWEEWAAALAAYDQALAVAAHHPDAMVGRTISLSQLGRAEEAIETATRVIDAGQWMMGEAYYWRAWNQLRLGHYDLARADADRARTQMANARVFVLSGVIEWRLKRLETAERDFQQAVTIDLGECEGAFDLGIVRDELRQAAASLAAFRQAGQCNDLSMTVRREAIATILGGSGTQTAKNRDVARHERVLKELEERRDEIARAIATLEKAPGSR